MQVTVILWSSESLVIAAITRGSILPALMSAMPVSSKVMFLFLSSASISGVGLPPLPSSPYSDGSGGRLTPPAEAAASAAPAGAGAAAAGSTAAAAGAAGADPAPFSSRPLASSRRSW